MARSYDVTDLVTLPTTDASSTVALLTRVVTIAHDAEHEIKLPAAIKRRVSALAVANNVLIDTLAARDPGKTISPQQQREADGAVDGGWSATYKWLLGWSLIDDKGGNHVIAQRLLDVLFPDGLRFTLAAYDKEWAEVKWRLARIESDGLDKSFAKLGGAAFLDRLIKDHKAYGVALAITDAGEKIPQAVLVREPLLAARRSLRSLVLLASAHAEDNPGDQELVDRILRPITEWQGPMAKTVADVPPAAPAPSPATQPS